MLSVFSTNQSRENSRIFFWPDAMVYMWVNLSALSKRFVPCAISAYYDRIWTGTNIARCCDQYDMVKVSKNKGRFNHKRTSDFSVEFFPREEVLLLPIRKNQVWMLIGNVLKFRSYELYVLGVLWKILHAYTHNTFKQSVP